MMRFLRSLLGSETKPIKRPNRRPATTSRRLGMEGLESRDLMAVGFAVVPAQIVTAQLEVVAPKTVQISIQNHDIYIRGTDGPDDVKVTYDGSGKYTVWVADPKTGRGIPKTLRPTGGDVFFYGNKGNDKFVASFSSGGYLHVTADGGDGDDNLTGSWGKDNLKGGNGRDTLIGQANDDKLDGGLGADYMDGRDGNDTLICGNDYEANGAYGGLGNDTITGSFGPDGLYGGGGNDTISGLDGDDIINGDGGVDYLYGGYGNDKLEGGDGNDFLYGSHGNDTLRGGKGLDTCYGDDGNDLLYGDFDGQLDLLYGQDGRDTFRLGLKYHDETWWHAVGGPVFTIITVATGEDTDGDVDGEDVAQDFQKDVDKIQQFF